MSERTKSERESVSFATRIGHRLEPHSCVRYRWYRCPTMSLPFHINSVARPCTAASALSFFSSFGYYSAGSEDMQRINLFDTKQNHQCEVEFMLCVWYGHELCAIHTFNAVLECAGERFYRHPRIERTVYICRRRRFWPTTVNRGTAAFAAV